MPDSDTEQTSGNGDQPDAWAEPENDPAVLRYELGIARAEIDRLRAVIAHPDALQVTVLDGEPHGPGRELIRGYPGDAGFDLPVSETVVVPSQTFVDVPCNLAVAFPPGMWGLIHGRSSTLRRYGLLVNSAVIDQGWRGPLFAGCWNLTDHDVTVEAGSRVAQIIPLPQISRELRLLYVENLRPGDRERAGFGSTGV